MSILEDMWYGNIIPYKHFLNDDPNFKSLLSLVDKNRDKLNGVLTQQLKERLEKYCDAADELHAITEQAAFGYGFSLGVRLMAESVFTKLNDDL